MQPRWSIDGFFEYAANEDDFWENAPDEIHFLGFHRVGTEDYDLYYMNWSNGQQDQVIVALYPDDPGDDDTTWTYVYEGVDDIDENSYDAVTVGLALARQADLIAEDNPQDDTGRDAYKRALLPVTHPSDTGRTVRNTAVYLGGARIKHEDYELYYAHEKAADPKNDERKAAPTVYVVNTVANSAHHYHADLTVPSEDDPAYRVALREAIRRARAQGFDFPVDRRFLQLLTENKTSVAVPAVPAPATQPATQKTKPGVTMSKETTQLATSGQKPKVTKFTHVEVVESHDEQIHLPAGMTKRQAREWLTQIEANEEQTINWSETIDAYPLDGALALRNVFERRFGAAVKEGATVRTFFGEKDVPPYMIAVEVGVDEVQYVPWGHFIIPVMPEHKIKAGVEFKEKQLFFKISGEIKRKYKGFMDEIAFQVREELKHGSIYKAKAFRIKFPTDQEMADEGYNPEDFAPKFINVAAAHDKLILSATVNEQIETNLFTPVEHTEQCKLLGIPLKRGILLEGRYGTGKTLTAAMLSRKCVENGWTFIYLNNVADLEKAMRFARRYEPAVIFAEDIDSVLQQQEGSKRDQAMNNILNTIDGVDMKRAEQMVVLTTNFVERINKAMLRPGRLDAVISVLPPDEIAVLQLMRHYAKNLLDNEGDEALMPAANLLAGQIPSVVREVVERSKLAAIGRSTKNSRVLTLQGEDLRIAAQGILSHIKLLEDPPVDNRSDIEKAADRLGSYLAAANNPSTASTSSAATVSTPAPNGNGKHNRETTRV